MMPLNEGTRMFSTILVVKFLGVNGRDSRLQCQVAVVMRWFIGMTYRHFQRQYNVARKVYSMGYEAYGMGLKIEGRTMEHSVGI